MDHVVPFTDAVAPERRQHRSLIAEARRWALASGRSFDPDLLALVCAASSSFGHSITDRWTRPRVNQLLVCDLLNWCSLHRCLVPDDVPRAVWRFVDFLSETGRLTGDSDALEHLREPLICYGGLGFDGEPRPVDGRRLFPCNCYWSVDPVERAREEREYEEWHGRPARRPPEPLGR